MRVLRGESSSGERAIKTFVSMSVRAQTPRRVIYECLCDTFKKEGEQTNERGLGQWDREVRSEKKRSRIVMRLRVQCDRPRTRRRRQAVGESSGGGPAATAEQKSDHSYNTRYNTIKKAPPTEFGTRLAVTEATDPPAADPPSSA